MSKEQHQRPSAGDREGWCAYWRARGMWWRTEPEIDDKRRRFLAERRQIVPSEERGIYPFKGIKLGRDDVEWLLAVQGVCLKPVDWNGIDSRTVLDLRGADLSDVNLSNLPLACLYAGLSEFDAINPIYGEEDTAPAHFERAILRGTGLEFAALGYAHLSGAIMSDARLVGATLNAAELRGTDLICAHLEGANLFAANMEHAKLARAQFYGAHLGECRLTRANLTGTYLAGVDLSDAHLEGAALKEAQLGGAQASPEQLGSIKTWAPYLPEVLPGADLRGAYFNDATDLTDAVFSSDKYGTAAVADTHWNSTNLAVVDWSKVTELGDEHREHSKGTALPTPFYGQYFKEPENRTVEAAARANTQLATVLRNQGIVGAADYFAYRGQVLQRVVLRQQRRVGQWCFSLFLWALAGYGFRLWRILAAYGVVLAVFSLIYWGLGIHSFSHESGLQALWDSFLVSLSAIHGRTTFEQVGAWSPAAWVAAIESVVGIVIEGVFVAMLVQRFFAR